MREIDHSSKEEATREYTRGLESTIKEKAQHSLFGDSNDTEKEEKQSKQPSLGKFIGPKMYIKIWFCPNHTN